MSRARERREAAKLKRQVPEQDDPDESEWDDVSGYELGGDEDDDHEEK